MGQIKRFVFIVLILFSADYLFSQSVGVGTTTPNAAIAILHVKVPNSSASPQGMILPQLSTTEMNNIPVSPVGKEADGLTVYDTTTHQIKYYDAEAQQWRALNTSDVETALWTAVSPNQILSTDTVAISTNSSFVPLELLHVDGTARFDSVIIKNGAKDGYVLMSDANGNASWKAIDNDGNGIFSGNGTVPTSTNVGLTDHLFFNDSTLTIAKNGNVGINTKSPAKKFHIVGDNNAHYIQAKSENKSAYTEWTDSSGVFRGLIGYDNAGFSGIADQFSIATWSNHDIAFFTNGDDLSTNGTASPRMIITKDGLVGVGDDNPSTRLEVEGDLKSDTLITDSIYVGDLGTAGQVLTSQGVGKSAVWSSIVGGDDLGSHKATKDVDLDTYALLVDTIKILSTVGESSIVIGDNSSVTGVRNIVIGNGAGKELSNQKRNILIGYRAGQKSITNEGAASLFIGYDAGLINTTGAQNTFIGYAAGVLNVTGGQNTFLGFLSGRNNTASSNTFLGYEAGFSNTTGNSNTYIGKNAGGKDLASASSTIGNTTGSKNTGVGFEAGVTQTTGNSNTFIGYQADATVDGLENATAIGALAKVSQSNSVILGNEAYVGIGVSAPQANLHLAIEDDTVGIRVEGTGDITGIGVFNNNTNGRSAVLLEAQSDSAIFEFDGNVFQINNLATDGIINLKSDTVIIENGAFKYVDGNQADGKVLVSDAYGVANWSNRSFPWTKNSSTLYLKANTDSVGIGTQSPESKLHVDGDIALGNSSAVEENAITVYLINRTGDPSKKGDIVIVDPSNNNSFVTTSQAGHASVVGVVYEDGVADGGYCKIAIAGIVEVSAYDGAVRGQHCITSTDEGKARSIATPSAGTSIGVWLETFTGSAKGKVLLK